MTDMITIKKKDYDSLIADKRELAALHDGGVDNWEWYSESLRNAGLLDDEEEEEDDE